MFSTEEAQPPPADSFEGSLPTFQAASVRSPQTVLGFDSDVNATGQLKSSGGTDTSTSSGPRLLRGKPPSTDIQGTTEQDTPPQQELSFSEFSSIDDEPDSESSLEFEPHRFKCESLFSSYPPFDMDGQPSPERQARVSAKQKHQNVNQRVDKAVQRERKHATVTRNVTDDKAIQPPKRATATTCSRKRWVGVSVMLVGGAILISVPVAILTRKDSVYTDASPPSPTLSPTMAPSLLQREPTFVQFPNPTTTVDGGLSDSSKMTMIVILAIAAGSAVLVGCIVYLRQRQLNSR